MKTAPIPQLRPFIMDVPTKLLDGQPGYCRVWISKSKSKSKFPNETQLVHIHTQTPTSYQQRKSETARERFLFPNQLTRDPQIVSNLLAPNLKMHSSNSTPCWWKPVAKWCQIRMGSERVLSILGLSFSWCINRISSKFKLFRLHSHHNGSLWQVYSGTRYCSCWGGRINCQYCRGRGSLP
jgi:hypothetical protein